MNNPLISIVCPLYNKEEYILQTIKSVAEQTSINWELLIIDDGSTDHSIQIAQSFMNVHSKYNIKLFHRSDFKKNKGASVCRNIGVDKASANFILFLDADDTLTKTCIENRMNFVNKYPNYDYYIFKVADYKHGKVMQKNLFLKLKRKFSYYFAKNKRHYYLKRFLKYDLPWQTSTLLWSKKALHTIDGFNEDFQRLQDPEIHTRLLLEKELKFKKAPQNYDVCHVKDDEVHDKSNFLFYQKRVGSIAFFVKTFIPLLEDHTPEISLKWLQGYLLAAEKMVQKDKHSQEDKLKRKNKKLLNDLYSDQLVKKITSLSYFNFLKYWSKSRKNYFLSKLKYPTLIFLIYKARL